jgi:hypothetical protein
MRCIFELPDGLEGIARLFPNSRVQLMEVDDAALTQRRRSLDADPDLRIPMLAENGVRARMRRRSRIAIRTPITERPPHRSRHAQFTHSAPTLGDGCQSVYQAMDEGYGGTAAVISMDYMIHILIAVTLPKNESRKSPAGPITA